MKKYCIFVLFLLSILCFSFACNQNGGADNSIYKDLFADNYMVDYGEVFYFDITNINGKNIKYEVKNGKESVDVYNYSFLATKTGNYTVKASLNGKVIREFTVFSEDNGSPNVSLDYYEKFITVGEEIELPKIVYSDNYDDNLSISKKLTFNNEEIILESDRFIAKEGSYKYTVEVEDGNGNKTVKNCVIYCGAELYMHTAIDWANAESPVKFYNPMYRTVMSIESEQTYLGTDSSFCVDMQELNSSACITFKNSLIDDISSYGYIVFYTYNDTNDKRQYSFNWTSEYAITADVGGWNAIVIPISEDLSNLSWNGYFRENHDWKDLNGMRIYIQESGSTLGKVYFSNVYLMDSVNGDEFESKVNKFLKMNNTDDYKTAFLEIDMLYNILLKEEKDYSDEYSQALDSYYKLYYGNDYGEDIVVYSEKHFGTSQIRGAGDVWSIPYSVRHSNVVKYGEEEGSVEVTVKPNVAYANLSLDKTSLGGYVREGMFEFYVKNETGAVLELFTEQSVANGGIYTVENCLEWQKVVLPCPVDETINGQFICVRGAGETVICRNEYAKFYISNIKTIQLDSEGVYFDTTNIDSISNNTSFWNGNASLSNSVKYNGQSTMKITNTNNNWGSAGVFINTSLLQALLNGELVKKVEISFNYYVESKSSNINFVYMGCPNGINHSQEIGTLNEWHLFSTEFSEVEPNTIIAISDNSTLSWSGNEDNAIFYIANITYKSIFYTEGEKPAKLDKKVDYEIKGVNALWQEPYSVSVTGDMVYNGEYLSTKIGFMPENKYATLNVYLPTTITKIESGCLDFYIYNDTGVELEIYTNPNEWSGVVTVENASSWQHVRLYASDSEDIEFITMFIRGKGETVVNATYVKYVYISLINNND